MTMNRLQFQAGLSMFDFLDCYGSKENVREDAHSKAQLLLASAPEMGPAERNARHQRAALVRSGHYCH